MAAPKYLERKVTTGHVDEVFASQSGPSANSVVSTGAEGTIDSSLLPPNTGFVKQVEIDFGALPVSEALFTITDASVTPTSYLTGDIAYVAPTGKDLDEIEMDVIDLVFGPGSGNFTLYARGRDGYVADKFRINYVIG